MACNTKAAYSGAVAALGFVCFAVGAAAVGLPLWGYFENPDAGYRPDDRGYFGPWQTCKQLLYNREACGPGVAGFRPVPAVWYAGLAAAGGVALLGAFCALSVLQLAMAVARERVLLPYAGVVGAKLALGLLAALLAAAAAGLFALQTDREDRFRVSRGEAFYLQVTLIVLNFALFVLALYDLLFARRPGGDPTRPDGGAGAHDAADAAAVAAAFGNPGFRESARGRGGGAGGPAVTAASGLPYGPPGGGGGAAGPANGSVSSVATNGSSSAASARSPLRSSLKKPRGAAGARGDAAVGIQNPGFSGHSPPLARNGSVKKVRIQTHSTAV
ncbi:hypothetical protein R5R35_014183 [Gryllus longicercus]|uniref:Uncharacterized protein n=1 Tax=Gryllus longicercus TaxID=2509291 RepID=A0AAN9VU72_9ORTH